MVRAKNGDRPLLEWGVATKSRPGEVTCGDLAVVTFFPNGALVATIDGLGHGPEAAHAALTAAAVVRRLAGDELVSLARECHEVLRPTRGAAVSLAAFSAPERTVAWLGIGNVEGRLVKANSRGARSSGSLPLLSGIAGHRLPSLRPAIFDLRPGDVLLSATDGIEVQFADSLDLSGSPQEIAERVVADHWKATDDALVLVARYFGVRQ